jgi:acylphosphatase
MICLRCIISGKVQGVWFRGSTQQQALRLGIEGYARNLPDGRVEVLACGSEAAVGQLQIWLRKGPPLARVDELFCHSTEDVPAGGFTTR